MTHATGLKYLKNGCLPLMWCPGCGHGITLGNMLRAFEELDFTNENTVVVTGIGCWGKADDYLVTNALHTTHGRALAFATGVKAYNPKLNVVVLMGDGDGVTIGGNHFIHAARRNIDLTAIIVNNYNYGMTGGQVSATTPSDRRTSTTVYGNPERELDVCALAEAAGANYVARGTVYHGWDLKNLIKEGLSKKGFSLVEVVSPCPTHFGRNNNMKVAVKMLNWLKEKGVTKEKYAQLTDSQKDGYFIIGKLVDRDAPDYNTRYEEIRARAMGS
ncbi:thiamine pyrophosphate-dependent enzyme [Desulfoscipio geothermicus]|uniref:2-oxoglutarate ferredoxin oxidoreductase subunit beta n=1 Tax=Desulfoscipio geothermicus DSM 3669 TaxID=1121426 RepID=A0A1I6D605_9FIRM|nr:thiamine pyrophosphate-dependent enzyme [Desulfoscipio geothermicus]SFR00888.1 2-oxoglutarate ferredoxin oxidoreductase subunit beta [Desulfoscipio geothermicus DSM 3669]